ncbi:hypothetical protein RDI58_005860 [Solanum bulbocastanum]|uniref:Uncharacterized protein n=1 Tax=Solanum bulbocastanum TaxID=147425 RepID=A0AAN8U989_SOLBU
MRIQMCLVARRLNSDSGDELSQTLPIFLSVIKLRPSRIRGIFGSHYQRDVILLAR